MGEVTEQEIKRALEAEALSYEIPPDVAGRTLAAAEDSSRKRIGAAFRKRAATRALQRNHQPRRWILAGGLAIVLLSFYGAGVIVQQEDESDTFGPLGRQGLETEPGAVAGLTKSKQPTRPFTTPEGSCDGGVCGGAVAPQSQGTASGDAGDGGGNGGSGGSGGGSSARASSTLATTPSSLPGSMPAAGSGTSIVRTGDMEVSVKKGDFSRSWTRAQTIAGKRGGFIISSNVEQVKGRLSRGTLSVRVPAAHLDETVTEFQRLGKTVRLNTSSSDVSGQLVDFDARIRAAQARELQLLELLKQARSVSDSLQISTPLSQVRAEIESAQAQRASVQNQVDLATLSVFFYEPQAAPEQPGPVKGRLGAAWEKAQDAALVTISTIFVGAGILLPILVLLAIAWAGLRFRRRAAIR
ncbi:MAG: DUF4349 domain-containing protein [Actinomycetota bacterium]